MKWLDRLFTDKDPADQWWIICRHTTLSMDAFVFGPFKSEEKARRYPDGLLGTLSDSQAFRYPYKPRVVSLPAGERPDAPEARFVG